MKFKFSAFVFSLASLAFTGLVCPNLHAKKAKLLSKDSVHKHAKTSFFSASDNAAQTFNSSTATPPVTPDFIPLTFTQHLHHHGDSIKSNGDQFRLKKGEYLVSFTGTFAAGTTATVDLVTFDFALQVGENFFFI